MKDDVSRPAGWRTKLGDAARVSVLVGVGAVIGYGIGMGEGGHRRHPDEDQAFVEPEDAAQPPTAVAASGTAVAGIVPTVTCTTGQWAWPANSTAVATGTSYATAGGGPSNRVTISNTGSGGIGSWTAHTDD